jgi:hypothetical protein
MNQGMFGGIGSGTGAASGLRKLSGQIRSGATQTTWTPVVSASGAGSVNVALTAGIRTRVVAVNGKGALRWFHGAAPAAGTDLTIEVVIDGVRSINQLVTLPAASSGSNAVYIAIGGGFGAAGTSQATAFWDWVPFDSSVELFLTSSTSATCAYGTVYDIHQ